MSSRTRLLVIAISAPVIAYVMIGGLLGKVMAREDTYQYLPVFDEVRRLISDNYVEDVKGDQVMRGAMHGLADALDPDSAFLLPEEVKQVESGVPLATGEVGLELTRQYYLRVVAARDGSPAANAGLRTGDYIRMIDDTPTREMSVWEGVRALRGAPGTKVRLTVIRGNAADPHVLELTREIIKSPDVTSRMAAPGVAYIRVAALGPGTVDRVKTVVNELGPSASKLIVDVRRSSSGPLDEGLDLARLFVDKGTLAIRESKGQREPLVADAGSGSIHLPTSVLIDNGTSGAAELFAAALAAAHRADLIGERTSGRAAVQKLVKLPDGSGLWLSTIQYLTPAGTPVNEKGVEPNVPVDEPEVEFGQAPAQTDPILDKALERAATKQAA
jgi:carboxyl-terminal processing protease